MFAAKKDHAEKGRFTFTTDEYEVYEICFISKVPHGMVHTKIFSIILNFILHEG